MLKKMSIAFFSLQLLFSSAINCQNIARDSVVFLEKNPISESLLTILRDRSTKFDAFQEATNKLANFLVLKVGEFLQVEKKEAMTPTDTMFKDGVVLKKNPILVPILRSGLALLPTFQHYFKGALVGMMGLKRNEETAEPMLYYANLPTIKRDDTIVILEPMLATGGSLSLALSVLKKAGATEKNIIIVTVVCVKEGVNKLKSQFPEITIISVALDPYLNEKAYIVPGLGDFGDRYFGNDSEPHFEILKNLG